MEKKNQFKKQNEKKNNKMCNKLNYLKSKNRSSRVSWLVL